MCICMCVFMCICVRANIQTYYRRGSVNIGQLPLSQLEFDCKITRRYIVQTPYLHTCEFGLYNNDYDDHGHHHNNHGHDHDHHGHHYDHDDDDDDDHHHHHHHVVIV